MDPLTNTKACYSPGFPTNLSQSFIHWTRERELPATILYAVMPQGPPFIFGLSVGRRRSMMKQINIHRLPGRLGTYTAVSVAILFATSGLFLAYGDWTPPGYRSVDPPVTTAVPAVARFGQRYDVSPKGRDSNDDSKA